MGEISRLINFFSGKKEDHPLQENRLSKEEDYPFYVALYGFITTGVLFTTTVTISWIWEEGNKPNQVSALEKMAALAGGGMIGSMVFGVVWQCIKFLRSFWQYDNCDFEDVELMNRGRDFNTYNAINTTRTV